MLRRVVPGHIYTSVVDRRLRGTASLRARATAPRRGRRALGSRKRHLATTKSFAPLGKLERRKIGVHAIAARLWNRWYDELMERRAARRPTLILLRPVLADPVLDLSLRPPSSRLRDEILVASSAASERIFSNRSPRCVHHRVPAPRSRAIALPSLGALAPVRKFHTVNKVPLL